MSNALLVIDVQQFYLHDIPADLPKRIVNHYTAIKYDHILFAVFKNTPDSNFVRSLKWYKCSSKKDSQLPAEFKPYTTAENTYDRSAYSAFKNPKLHTYLKGLGVERLTLCGVDSDACVLGTAFEAFDLGYHVKVEHSLTYSSGKLDKAAEEIYERSIISRD